MNLADRVIQEIEEQVKADIESALQFTAGKQPSQVLKIASTLVVTAINLQEESSLDWRETLCLMDLKQANALLWANTESSNRNLIGVALELVQLDSVHQVILPIYESWYAEACYG